MPDALQAQNDVAVFIVVVPVLQGQLQFVHWQCTFQASFRYFRRLSLLNRLYNSAGVDQLVLELARPITPDFEYLTLKTVVFLTLMACLITLLIFATPLTFLLSLLFYHVQAVLLNADHTILGAKIVVTYQIAVVVQVLPVVDLLLELRHLVHALLTDAEVALEVIVDLQPQDHWRQLADVAPVLVRPHIPTHELVADGATHVHDGQGPAVAAVLGGATPAYGPGQRALMALLTFLPLDQVSVHIDFDFEGVPLLALEGPLQGLFCLLLRRNVLAVPIVLYKLMNAGQDLGA